MSTFRLQCTLAFDSGVNAAAGKTLLDAQLVGKDIQETGVYTALTALAVSLEPTGGIVPGPGLYGDWQFTTELDRDAIKAYLLGVVTNGVLTRQKIPSVLLTWHECTHGDSVVQSCRETGYGELVL